MRFSSIWIELSVLIDLINGHLLIVLWLLEALKVVSKTVFSATRDDHVVKYIILTF